jgi:hypothetical protein
MHQLRCFHLSAAALAFAALVGVEGQGVELEGALQYPPSSVGEDAQPRPPARAVPQLVSPATHRIGRQRVKPAARHTIVPNPPADLGTWSTAGDRKRTLVASMDPDPSEMAAR